MGHKRKETLFLIINTVYTIFAWIIAVSGDSLPQRTGVRRRIFQIIDSNQSLVKGRKGGMLYYFKHMTSKQIINNLKVHQRREAQWHKIFNGNRSCLCNSVLPSKTIYSTSLACTQCAERALELSRACQSHALLWHFKGSSTVLCKLSLQMWKRYCKCITGSFKGIQNTDHDLLVTAREHSKGKLPKMPNNKENLHRTLDSFYVAMEDSALLKCRSSWFRELAFLAEQLTQS